MALFIPDLQIESISKKLIRKYDDIGYIDTREVLFLSELETRPGKGGIGARCYRLVDHPVQAFTPHRFGITVYRLNVDYMTPQQLAILIYHELLHIPAKGDKLVDHDRKDFRRILGIDIDWHQPGRLVPDILQGGD